MRRVERVLFYVGAAVCGVYATGVVLWHFPHESGTVAMLSALLGIQWLDNALNGERKEKQ